jgi:sirohydrochlorin ferrochelatase
MSLSSALFLIGHGTRSKRGVSQLRELAERIAAERPDVPVGLGIIEHAEPSLDDGLDELVRSDPDIAHGRRKVVAVPLVLLGAGHMKDDGPLALARARKLYPDLDAAYASALGVHPKVLAAAETRILEAGGAGADAVVLVARGSTDPDANSDLYKVARLLADGRGIAAGLFGAFDATGTEGTPGSTHTRNPGQLGLVEPAFVSLAAPGVIDALARCRLLGARRISVVPYFLFHGVLIDRINEQVSEFVERHLDVEVQLGRELYPDPRINALVWHRYEQALAGQATMNCDCCIHRADFLADVIWKT